MAVNKHSMPKNRRFIGRLSSYNSLNVVATVEITNYGLFSLLDVIGSCLNRLKYSHDGRKHSLRKYRRITGGFSSYSSLKVIENVEITNFGYIYLNRRNRKLPK